MIIRATEIPRFDPANGMAMRTYLESLRGSLQNERSSWDTQYDQLARFFQPRATRFNASSVDQGERKDFSIVNELGTLCLRTLRAGMLSGMSSPSRTWFKTQMERDDLNDNSEVKAYLETGDNILRDYFLKSNFYQTLHNSYGEEGLFGTTAFLMMEDPITAFRCHPWPVGSYYISGDDTLRIDMAMRELSMTPRQMVMQFGVENCSKSIQTYYNSSSGGLKEQWFQVIQCIYKNTYFDPNDVSDKPWNSVYYELASYKTDGKDPGILKRSGFHEFPLICGRWDVVGENFYGESPAMDCLGTNMGLQLAEMRTQQAIDKMVDPPMVGNSALQGQKASILPGDITWVDDRDGKAGFRPAFQVQYELQWAMKNIERFEARIRTALFTDLFLMISGSDRREVTAEEIQAKMEEKMQVIGPVLERNNSEVLAPAVMRARSILERQGRMPKRPKIIEGQQFKMAFTSILAQAQKLLGVANIERFLATVGNEVAVDQGILDSVDLDETVRELARDLSIPAKLLRTPAQVAKMRSDREAAQRQQANADNAQKLSAAAVNMASADTSNKSLLTDLMPNIGAA